MNRRKFLSVGLAAAVCTSGGCLQFSQSSSISLPEKGSATGEWPQYANNAGNTRFSPTKNAPTSDLKTKWTRNGATYRTPHVYRDGVLVTGDAHSNTISAFDVNDDSLRWTEKFDYLLSAQTTLYQEQLIVLSGRNIPAHELHALSVEDGEHVWQKDIRLTNLPPTLFDDTLYHPAPRGVTAIDPSTPRVRWNRQLSPRSVETDSGSTRVVDWVTPAVGETHVVTFDRNETDGATRRVVALEKSTGEIGWSKTLDFSVNDERSISAIGHPILQDGIVYLSYSVRSSGYEALADTTATEKASESVVEIFAIDAETGDTRWNETLQSNGLYPPAVAGNGLFYSLYDPTAEVYEVTAFDTETGERAWTLEVSGRLSPPTLSANSVYVARSDPAPKKALIAIDPESGKERGRKTFEAKAISAPLIGEENVYLNLTREAGVTLVALSHE